METVATTSCADMFTDEPMPKITEWDVTIRNREAVKRNDLDAFKRTLVRNRVIAEGIGRNDLQDFADALGLQTS